VQITPGLYYNRNEANKRKGGNALLTTYIEVSRENGFVLLVYDNPHEPLFGIRFDPDTLDELIEAMSLSKRGRLSTK